MFLIPWPLRVFQKISLQLPWRLQNTGQWHANMAFGIPLSPHFNFGQTISNPIALGMASECVFTTFFWTPTSHTLHQLSEDVLFGCFVIAVNAAFTQQLSLSDEGYESGSKTADLTTSSCKTPRIHHVSSMEHASFDLAHTTPCCPTTTLNHGSPSTPPRPVHCHLSFTSDTSEDGQDPNSSPEYSDDEEEFQTVHLDDEHWMMEIVPERTFCIHENGSPNNVC